MRLQTYLASLTFTHLPLTLKHQQPSNLINLSLAKSKFPSILIQEQDLRGLCRMVSIILLLDQYALRWPVTSPDGVTIEFHSIGKP